MITLRVTGMTCEHCEKAVSQALAVVDGVEKVVDVSRERNEAIVEGSADAQALIAAVQEEGYEAGVAS